MTTSVGRRPLLVVGAHAADFVWRAGGVIAKHTAAGWEATVVALSYGERGESGELWREEGQTVERVKQIRDAEARAAAEAVGATFVPYDLGDYPLEVPAAVERRLTDLMVELAPATVLTHTAVDPFNPDHPVAHRAVARARLLAMGAGGVPAAFPTIRPPALFVFEPHQPEACGFAPDTFVDVTAVWERKQAAMAAMGSQRYLAEHYAERNRQRAVQSRYAGTDRGTRQVEVFQRLTPELRELL
jgi:4-oxalomesaconate hydratase